MFHIYEYDGEPVWHLRNGSASQALKILIDYEYYKLIQLFVSTKGGLKEIDKKLFIKLCSGID